MRPRDPFDQFDRTFNRLAVAAFVIAVAVLAGIGFVAYKLLAHFGVL
ncbi:MAG: hypothetical protein ACO1ON_13040 [Nocardioides sp.]